MRAIIDIPAKTPKPIGNTESFLPGMTKAAALDVVESAAAVPEGVASASAAPATVGVADVLDDKDEADKPETAIAGVVGAAAEAEVVESVASDETITEEKPFTEIAVLPPLRAGAGVGEDGDDDATLLDALLVGGIDTATEVNPFTDMAGLPLGDAAAAEPLAAEDPGELVGTLPGNVNVVTG